MQEMLRRLPGWVAPLGLFCLGFLAMALRAQTRFALPETPTSGLEAGWLQTAEHPALVAVGRNHRPLANFSTESISAMESSAQFLSLRLWLSEDVAGLPGVSSDQVDGLVSLSLAPAAWWEVQNRCPLDPTRSVPEGLDGLLCDSSLVRQVERQVDHGLVRAFGHGFDVAARFRQDEDDLGLLAAEVAAGLGARGAKLAALALEDDAAPPRSRALALWVLARTLPREEALQLLKGQLDRTDGVEVAAALEFARLGGEVSVLEAMAERMDSDAFGQVVRFAAAGMEVAP